MRNPLVNVARTTTTDARLALIKVLPRISKQLTALLAALILVEVLITTGFLIASGALVGELATLIGDGVEAGLDDRLLATIGFTVATLLVMQTLPPFREALTQTLGRRLEAFLRTRAMTASLAQHGIARLEEPASGDLVSQVRGAAMAQYTPALALWGAVDFVMARLRALSAAVLIAIFAQWWLAVGLLVVFQFVRIWSRRPLYEGVKVLTGTSSHYRRANYFLDLALTARPAKETRIFGLSGWIVDRLQSLSLAPMRQLWAERKAAMVRSVPWLGALVLLAALFAFTITGRSAVEGEISLAALAIVAPAIITLIVEMLTTTHTDAWFEFGSTPIPAVLEFAHGTPGISAASQIATPDMPRHEIHFEDVSFTYPGTSAPVFQNLNLTIPAGRSLAIVGENGAGKTTLIKLLCRLYEPTGGRITVDGIDLREFDPASWRRRLSVIFQDFARYELTARENVVFGAIGHANDHRALERALERAGATDIIAGLPHGDDTVLSRRYEGGADLSGGQWQRIALARSLFAVEAGAGVLILDEPTASLDVRAEAALYDRFLDLTRGTTTLLISHRFSTVRRADAICVIEHGQVRELGSHDELMARDGRYAELYTLQASRFEEAGVTEEQVKTVNDGARP